MPAHPKPFSPPTEQFYLPTGKLAYGLIGAPGHTVTAGALKAASQIGEQITKQHGILITLAQDGVCVTAAAAAVKAGGTAVGLSPAQSAHEHAQIFRLPTQGFSVIIFIGQTVPALQAIMAASSDTLIFICGRQDYMIDIESNIMSTPKPVAIMTTGTGQTAEVSHLSHRVKAAAPGIVFETKPKLLIKKLAELADEQL